MFAGTVTFGAVVSTTKTICVHDDGTGHPDRVVDRTRAKLVLQLLPALTVTDGLVEGPTIEPPPLIVQLKLELAAGPE